MDELEVYEEIIDGILVNMYFDLVLEERFDMIDEAAQVLRIYLN
jgi:hypothetical protein